jgi:hypothetical protein
MLQRDRQRQRERGTAGGGGAGAFTAEYLVVAGGGGSGAGGGTVRAAGGGGAGGYRSSVTGESSGGGASAESALSIALGTPYTVTVGSGGAGALLASAGSDGNLSVFASISSAGGGGGGEGSSTTNQNNGRNGGSGGGTGNLGTGTTPIPGNGTAGQGFSGGAGLTLNVSPYSGSGGGGAGSAGGPATVSGSGSGGSGLASLITGLSVIRAAGGAARVGTNASGIAGAANSGDGATAPTGSSGPTAAGGSGVVIIRVPSSVVAEFSAGVVYNYIPLDDFNVYEITAAGVADTVTFSQGALATIDDSLRFNDDDSAYLSRTPSVAGDRKTWTWAGWVKLGNIGIRRSLFVTTNPPGGDYAGFEILDTNSLMLNMNNTSPSVQADLRTSAVFRDPSAWYHVVLAVDTTAAQASDRIKIYINGAQESDFSVATYPPLNYDTRVNTTNSHNIGSYLPGATRYFDGYLSDVYFIDGQALDPSRFGKQDSDGVWQPISYTGTYGTNGFHLDFADNSTAAALGTDVSGNGNDWTPSGITTDDQVSDTPSVNYCTLNVTRKSNTVASNGNLRLTGATQTTAQTSTFSVTSGKWYWETTATSLNESSLARWQAGVVTNEWLAFYSETGTSGDDTIAGNNGTVAIRANGSVDVETTNVVPSGSNLTEGDVVGFALNADDDELTIYVNNTALNSGVPFDISGLAQTGYVPAFRVYNTDEVHDINFGQLGFAYTPPTGFVALNSANLPAPVIADGKEHFQPALYTGNGTTQAIGGLEFQPDFVWIKNRSAALNHVLSDAVRGANNALFSSNTDAEFNSTLNVTAFNSNGFTVGSGNPTNGTGNAIVAWNWNAGGSTVTNTDGTITSQVRANTTAGFSIVGYTGGASGSTVGHGLGKAPDFIIAKSRTSAYVWVIYSSYLGKDKYLLFDTSASGTLANYWGATAPDSSVFGLSASGNANNQGDMIAYCFTGVDGFSKFGSYTGNGSADGPFVYTGFRPAFVMVKATSVSGESWAIMDNKRLGYNVTNSFVQANSSTAEYSYGGGGSDILSNGFKLRSTSTGLNGSGITFIYMAFAENPFKTARAR